MRYLVALALVSVGAIVKGLAPPKAEEVAVIAYVVVAGAGINMYQQRSRGVPPALLLRSVIIQAAIALIVLLALALIGAFDRRIALAATACLVGIGIALSLQRRKFKRKNDEVGAGS